MHITTERKVSKLLHDPRYLRYPSTVFAVDFDGTCVASVYPNPGVGHDIGAVPVLRRLVEAGHRIILYTMRSGDGLADAVKWFEDKGIPLFGVNHNPEQIEWTDSAKIYANVYIDDHAFGVPLIYPHGGLPPYVDWHRVELMIFGD